MAIDKANILNVPLIVAGDLHDTKANLRGECVLAMIDTFNLCHKKPYIIIGNHCRLNEKDVKHSLTFLAPYAHIVDIEASTSLDDKTKQYLIAYHHDTGQLQKHLETIPKGSIVICHQGVHGSNSGEYIQDKTAVSKECFADFRTISGHYHARQDIKCGRPRKGGVGLFSYIGNPYTLNYGEANDPEKGFQVLHDDGSLEFVPTNLRKHIVYDLDINFLTPLSSLYLACNKEDLVWVKIHGSKSYMAPWDKDQCRRCIHGISDMEFKLTYHAKEITTNTDPMSRLEAALCIEDTLDTMIAEATNIPVEQKLRLKALWKDL